VRDNLQTDSGWNDLLRQEKRRTTKLEAELADYKADRKRVLDGPCVRGELHCSCVVELRAKIEELKAENGLLLRTTSVISEELEAKP